MGNKEKKLNYIIVILIFIVVVIFSLLIVFILKDNNIFQGLGEKECIDCPYKHELKISDLNFKTKIDSKQYNQAKIKVDVYTGHDSVRVNGSVNVDVICNFNYCFSSSYISNCQWNYEANGRTTLEFDDSSSEYDYVNVFVYSPPNSIYNYLDDISCEVSITDVKGELLIYGEKVN